MLEVAGTDFANVVMFHSLSKRSSLPGLRVGFAAGDKTLHRSASSTCARSSAPQVPVPGAGGRDRAPITTKRMWKKTARSIARSSISPTRSSATATATSARPAASSCGSTCRQHGGSEGATLKLWKEAGLRVVPGNYAARPQADGRNPGDGYIRVAMVQDRETTAEALHRLVAVLG